MQADSNAHGVGQGAMIEALLQIMQQTQQTILDQASLIKGLQHQVTSLAASPLSKDHMGDIQATPKIDAAKKLRATPAADRDQAGATPWPLKTSTYSDYEGEHHEYDDFNKTAKTLTGSAALKQQIQSAESRSKMEFTLPPHDPYDGKTLHTRWRKDVWMVFRKRRISWVLDVSLYPVEAGNRERALSHAKDLACVFLGGDISAAESDQDLVFNALRQCSSREIAQHASTIVNHSERGTKIWERINVVAFRRGHQRRMEWSDSIRAVASAPYVGPFQHVKTTVEQLVEEYNTFGGEYATDYDEWRIATFLITSGLPRSPHPEWSNWIQVRCTDLHLQRERGEMDWVKFSELIEEREDTMPQLVTKRAPPG